MTPRFIGALIVFVILSAGCTDDSTIERSGTDGASPGDATTLEVTADDTTTTAPPAILALSPNLALAPGQCYADIPPATTTTTPPVTVEGETASIAPTVPPTLPPPTTTIPRPATVAVVDCGGSNDGQVFASFCLAPHPEFDDDLTAAACPGGDDEGDYPGNRTIRRAATRICLQRFEELFGEPYALSTRTATEFVPTAGLWELGDHRVVCLATAPVEPESHEG